MPLKENKHQESRAARHTAENLRFTPCSAMYFEFGMAKVMMKAAGSDGSVDCHWAITVVSPLTTIVSPGFSAFAVAANAAPGLIGHARAHTV